MKVLTGNRVRGRQPHQTQYNQDKTSNTSGVDARDDPINAPLPSEPSDNRNSSSVRGVTGDDSVDLNSTSGRSFNNGVNGVNISRLVASLTTYIHQHQRAGFKYTKRNKKYKKNIHKKQFKIN